MTINIKHFIINIKFTFFKVIILEVIGKHLHKYLFIRFTEINFNIGYLLYKKNQPILLTNLH